MKLVIVESPAKAKTIEKYLGKGFKVLASFGHIRDLPSKPGSVLPEQDFEMKYVISDKSIKYIKDIIKHAKKSTEIYLATDPDREGESISWHVIETLIEEKVVQDKSVFYRVAFNEITKKAVLDAVANPRSIDDDLVNAQQARRALDYLVGFTLSPVLWRKLPGCRSAGRVQSVALRLLCEREHEIERFVREEYWDIHLHMLSSNKEEFTARLTHIDNNKLEKFSIVKEEAAKTIVDELRNQQYSVDSIEKKKQRRNPPTPFITSSLQQEASRKLGFSAKKTMQVAQKLYEGIDIDGQTIGLITYMRTDGVTLSSEAVKSIRSLINKKFGKDYLPDSARIYKSKSKNAQEAHEAIRPTNIDFIPTEIKSNLNIDQYKLYDLIWKRTMACQMANVIIDMVSVNIISGDKKFLARATGSTINFDGFYKIYQEGLDDSAEEKNKMLPKLSKGEELEAKDIKPEQHFTEPPPRYSEASLVKKLEELGIGRPSTYATIISVLQDRSYASIEKRRFYPSELGIVLNVFLVEFFKKYVEYDFTAKLELDLDEVASGKVKWKTLLGDFWQGFNQNILSMQDHKIGEVIEYVQKELDFHLFGDPKSKEYEKNKKCLECTDGKLELKLGKFGAFLACNKYPTCTFKKSINKISNDGNSDEAESQENSKENSQLHNKELGKNKDDEIIYLKKGPYGWYIQLGDPKPKMKPKRAPVPKSIKIDDIDLDIAQKLLNLPMKIGNHSKTNDEILMGIGKFGSYLKYQNKFTSIPKNIDPFSIDTLQAEEIIANKVEKKKTKK